jgi:undecaprenyl-diphosphatase
MTTLQAAVYGTAQGFAEFLPISPEAHRALIAYFLSWDAPSSDMMGAFYLGTFLASLLYFRHDWASFISSFLQVVLLRRRPMTMDERLPFFMLVAILPLAAVWHYASEQLGAMNLDPLRLSGLLALFGAVLLFAESRSRRNKASYDWNWGDAILVGLFQTLAFVPGAGRITGVLAIAFLRGYQREAAYKFAFYCGMPLLAAGAFVPLRDIQQHGLHPDVSWLTFGTGALVSFVFGLLAIGGMMRHAQRRTFNHHATYRFLLALVVVVVYFIRGGAEG